MRFAVKAETHEGSIHALRYFPTREEAEDHPVRLATWKRVWIEQVDSAPALPAYAPPFPWQFEWERSNTYVRDGEGRRFAILMGSEARRVETVKLLCSIPGFAESAA